MMLMPGYFFCSARTATRTTRYRAKKPLAITAVCTSNGVRFNRIEVMLTLYALLATPGQPTRPAVLRESLSHGRGPEPDGCLSHRRCSRLPSVR